MAAQTIPPAAEIADRSVSRGGGALGGRSKPPTSDAFPDEGSIRKMLVPVTAHTASSPIDTLRAGPGVGIDAVALSEAGSIFRTTSLVPSATHTAPCPTAIPRGSWATPLITVTLFVTGSILRTE